VEFRLLGPLEIVDDGQTLPLPGGKALALLAALLLRRRRVGRHSATRRRNAQPPSWPMRFRSGEGHRSRI
jgi:MYXO-CTERM domain-containing protein